MLKSMRKSKNRYVYDICVSPGDAPGAITLNVEYRGIVHPGSLASAILAPMTSSYDVIMTSSYE